MNNSTLKYVRISDATFKKEVLEHNTLVMVEFGANWCGPCHIIAGSLDELAAQYNGQMKFCRIDADENPISKEKYSIYYLPTLLYFLNGKLVDQITGTKSRSEIENRIKLHLK